MAGPANETFGEVIATATVTPPVTRLPPAPRVPPSGPQAAAALQPPGSALPSRQYCIRRWIKDESFDPLRPATGVPKPSISEIASATVRVRPGGDMRRLENGVYEQACKPLAERKQMSSNHP